MHVDTRLRRAWVWGYWSVKGSSVNIISWNKGKLNGGYALVLVLLLSVLLSALVFSLNIVFKDKIKIFGFALGNEPKGGLQFL